WRDGPGHLLPPAPPRGPRGRGRRHGLRGRRRGRPVVGLVAHRFRRAGAPSGDAAMTTYLEPPLFDVDASGHPSELLEAVADHYLPSRVDDRAAIEAAIAASLAEHGVVHISH